MEQYFAKSHPVKTIEEHTMDVLEKYEEMKKKYPNILNDEEWKLLELAVLYHDFGKMDVKFQNRIRKAIGMPPIRDEAKNIDEIPHNYLSPCFIREDVKNNIGKTNYEILIKSIYYHHDRKEIENKEIRNYIKNFLDIKRENVVINKNTIPIDKKAHFLNEVRFDKEVKVHLVEKYIKIKGLLNRMDYAASGDLDQLEEDCLYEDGKGLYEKVKSFFMRTDKKERALQVDIQNCTGNNQIVIAATGAGKTEAALFWLGNHKGFYTLPLKVSINAIYKRIQQEIQYDKVGLLHGDAFSFYLDERKNDDLAEYTQAHMAYTNSKMLSKPLTVCTIDQLFKFVYRYNGGEAALSTLAYSKLVIDEIQMYSTDLVATIIVALKRITDLGGKFLIITATFPPVLYEFFYKHGIDAPKPKKNYYGAVKRRHRIKIIDDFPDNAIIKKAQNKKVLIITNTVKRAQEIYEQLGEENISYVRLLHSQFIKKHRTELEDEIIKFAPNQGNKNVNSGIWISTQIVEASLDIDFDVLYTEMCSIDSLLQRMGRIYRNREYDGVLPNIYIIDNKNGKGTIIDREIYEFSLEALKDFDGQLLEESDMKDDKQELINKVYDSASNPNILESKYYHSVENKINHLLNLRMYQLNKTDALYQFRNIHSISIIPETVYEELIQDGKISKWQSILQSNTTPQEEKHRLKNEIMQYTINLSLSDNDYLRDKKKSTMTEIIYTGSQIYVAPGTYEYDKKRNKATGYIYIDKVIVGVGMI